MNSTPRCRIAVLSASFALLTSVALAQIGTRFPSERKVIPDPVTGIPLTFLTTASGKGDSKIYQTHHQWTADGKWLIFRSRRAGGEAMAVNEETGVMVQVTEGGYAGMLCLADHSMHLYFLRIPMERPASPMQGNEPAVPPPPRAADAIPPAPGATRPGGGFGGRGRQTGPAQIVQVDLAKLLADSEAGKMQPADAYQKVCGAIPVEWGPGGDMALDCTEEYAYFRVGKEESAKHLAPDVKPAETFGPRSMGSGPNGLGRMNLKTGEVNFVVAVPFQIGHVQTNPWMPGEIVFCWETGGKAPQRTWTVMGDGSGLRPLFPEAPFDWVTHEAVITKDEVAIAILAHRPVKIPDSKKVDGPGQEDAWGPSGTAEHPTGLGIVNLRTREMRIIGQVPFGNPGRSDWHVNGSPDGRWGVFDDFLYRLWLVDRRSGETIMLADLGHMTTAADHIHPTFNADSTKIEVQSAMLSAGGDKRSLNIVVVPVPESWLNKTYPTTFK
jgi:oligogalacturonide lyase